MSGQSGPPSCLEKRKMEAVLELTELNLKTVTQSSSLFDPNLWTLSETTNIATMDLMIKK